MTAYDYDAGTVSYRIFVSGLTFPRSYSCVVTATCYRPPSSTYIKTITTTTIDGPTISILSNTISGNDIYYFPSHLLSIVSCSGRGDEQDRILVTSVWDDLEAYYSLLPNDYQTAFSNGSLEDDNLISALERYDYCVFHKNYGLSDFANRSESSNRYYSKYNNKIMIIDHDNSGVVIVIISSVIAILSMTVLTVLLIKKKSRK